MFNTTLGLIFTFVIEVMLFGGLLVPEDIRKTLKRIEEQKQIPK